MSLMRVETFKPEIPLFCDLVKWKAGLPLSLPPDTQAEIFTRERFFNSQEPKAAHHALFSTVFTRPEDEAAYEETLDGLSALVLVRYQGNYASSAQLNQIGPWGHIENVMTRPDLQGRGLAPIAMYDLLGFARSYCRWLVLNCMPERTRFYQQFGFKNIQ